MRVVLLTLLISTLLALTACKSLSRRIKLPPPPEPPVVNCAENARGDKLPRPPKYDKMPAEEKPDAWWREYVRRQLAKASEVIAQLYGTIEADRTMRTTTAECIQRERDAGRIR